MGEQSKLETISRKFIHDIRTPISVLSMLTSIFESREFTTEDINIMKEELTKMETMVQKYADQVKVLY